MDLLLACPGAKHQKRAIKHVAAPKEHQSVLGLRAMQKVGGSRPVLASSKASWGRRTNKNQQQQQSNVTTAPEFPAVTLVSYNA